MTDDHATNGCGHNHDPNPYAADPDEAAGFYELVLQLHRCLVMTVHIDAQATGKFAVMSAVGAQTATRDLVTTIKAMLWELADIVQIMTHGKELRTEYRQCADPTHDHDHEKDRHQFGFDTMDAFFDAASRGDLQGAVNVVDAVMADGTLGEGDPEFAATVMFANAMVSSAATVRRAVPDGMFLFTP